MYIDAIDLSRPSLDNARIFAALYANEANRNIIDQLKDALDEMPHCYFKLVKNLDSEASPYLVFLKGLFMAAVGNPELLDPPPPPSDSSPLRLLEGPSSKRRAAEPSHAA